MVSEPTNHGECKKDALVQLLMEDDLTHSVSSQEQRLQRGNEQKYWA